MLPNSSIRKKRNFKGLQLNESPLATPKPSLQPTTDTASSSSTFPSTSSSSLTPNNPTPSINGGATASANGYPDVRDLEPNSGSNYHNKLSEQLANLELGIEYKLDLKNEDLTILGELGAGNGGTVTKVLHEKSGTVMAKKVVFIDAKPTVRKQILRELQILHECNSKYIVSFYGAYLSEPHICMCMEFMDKGSLDSIYKKYGPISAEICGKIVVVVVQGLTYLYDVHRIIHRDVKPSNILVNGSGQIKICDFGVSGELINSIADTFVGTSTYMSPERIQGDQYSVKSDVWSLGVSVIELALGRFPFAEEEANSDECEEEDEDESDELADEELTIPDDLAGTLSPTKPAPRVVASSKKKKSSSKEKASKTSFDKSKGSSSSKKKRNGKKGSSKGGVSLEGSSVQMSILDLLQHIVNEPPPKLPEGKFPKEMDEFINLCLVKDPAKRPTPKDLTKHPYVIEAENAKVDLVGWVKSMH